MQYLGIDVHSRASVWCLLDGDGNTVETGKVGTTVPELQSLVQGLGEGEPMMCAQEVGTQTYLVHDAITATGTKILSFNAAHLRMIAASRKKCDRRDAYWIARTLQTGLMPHPVYIPPAPIRTLRRLLQRRAQLVLDRRRWHNRARAALRSHGVLTGCGRPRLMKLLDQLFEDPTGLDTDTVEHVELCHDFIEKLDQEIREVDLLLETKVNGNAVVERLQTIPGVGKQVAITLYATIGEIERFPNFAQLSSYVGLVPSVYQSAERTVHGKITKQGNGALRAVLVQGAHRVSVSTRDDAALRIPGRPGQGFRADLGKDSGPTWAGIPGHLGKNSGPPGQGFRATWADQRE